MTMATAKRPMPDAPMSALEIRLERVHRAHALDQAVTQMVGRYADSIQLVACGDRPTGPARPDEVERLRRAAHRQYRAFTRLLYALARLAQSTDADLQRSATRS